MLSLAFAATLIVQAAQDAPVQHPPVSELEDVVVQGRNVREAATEFVQSVAQPVPGRKAARWRTSVCVGAAGLPAEASQALVDRVSDWAHAVGLEVQPPGCEPDIFIVATPDARATARALVASRPREFRTGVSGSDQGSAALARFQDSDAPVRWWHVSLPVNADTGMPMRRLPRQQPWEPASSSLTRPADFGPMGHIVAGSRLTDFTRDDFQQVIVVLDAAALDQAAFHQIADYVALVSLVQVDPDSAPEQPSILTLFEPGRVQEETLTLWDRALIHGLYGAEQRRRGRDAALSDIAANVAQAAQQETEAAGNPDHPADPLP